MRQSKLLAFAQLLRLPNVFTAFADIAMAGAASGLVATNPGSFCLLLLASGCLYLSGMVFNDFFDRHTDAITQRFRPIPSGRVSARTAFLIAVSLMLAGLGVSFLAGMLSFWVTLALAGAILLYNLLLKHTAIGPIGMGACRGLNVLLGLSAAGPELFTAVNLHLAGVVGLYIVGVTWFARTEESESKSRTLVLAAVVQLIAVCAVLFVPVHFPAGTVSWLLPYLVIAFLFVLELPIVRAICRPEPKYVQAAVKRSILGLIALDAILAVAFVGWPGLAILLLLPPAIVLGKWVYST